MLGFFFRHTTTHGLTRASFALDWADWFTWMY